MRKAILILLICSSCISENNKEINIKGNWYVLSMKDRKVLYYVETYIDENSFHYYDENVGLKPSMDYLIEDGELYYLDYTKKSSKEKTKENTGNLDIIDDNTFSMYNEKIIMKRIENGLKLEDFLKNNIPEIDYQKYFYKRRSQWEKLLLNR